VTVIESDDDKSAIPSLLAQTDLSNLCGYHGIPFLALWSDKCSTGSLLQDLSIIRVDHC